MPLSCPALAEAATPVGRSSRPLRSLDPRGCGDICSGVSDKRTRSPEGSTAKGGRNVTPAAQRALAEAAERRAAADRNAPAKPPKEIGGPSGPEPTRYGDWEKKGLASDF